MSGPDGARGWLFGTIHALPDGTEWRTPRLEQSLAQANLLVVEVADLADVNAGSRAFAAVSQSPGLPPLLERLPAAQRPALAKALERAGLDPLELRQTESWAAALIVANAQQAGEAGNGVDRALLARGGPVMALEGFPQQFALFDRLPAQDQRDLLYLATVESTPEEERAMAAAWVRGDLAAIEREAAEGVLADPELRQALLVERNLAWADKVAALLEQGRRPFVAVGAAHMLGAVGLPAMLTERGFTVRRIQ